MQSTMSERWGVVQNNSLMPSYPKPPPRPKSTFNPERGIPIAEYYGRRKEKVKARAVKGKALGLRKTVSIKSVTQNLDKRLDHLCSVLVRIINKRKNGGKCQVCGWRMATCAYHIIPRGKKAIRWNMKNILAGCDPCNDGERWHRLEYADKHKAIIGESAYAELKELSKGKSKFSRDEKWQMIAGFQEQINNVLSTPICPKQKL